jgi:hypothetical protein
VSFSTASLYAVLDYSAGFSIFSIATSKLFLQVLQLVVSIICKVPLLFLKSFKLLRFLQKDILQLRKLAIKVKIRIRKLKSNYDWDTSWNRFVLYLKEQKLKLLN